MNKLLLLLAAALSVSAQSLDALLARMDREAGTLTGATADLRRTIYVASIKSTDADQGTIQVRRASAGKLEFRIDIMGEDAVSLVVRHGNLEYYHPQMNQTDVYDLSHYGIKPQMLMALGFGTSGRDLKANWTITNPRHDTVSGMATTAVDLAPKSADLADKLHLKKVELWIADSNLAPVREKLYTSSDTTTVDYSNVQLNVKIPESALDLPKGAKHVKH